MFMTYQTDPGNCDKIMFPFSILQKRTKAWDGWLAQAAQTGSGKAGFAAQDSSSCSLQLLNHRAKFQSSSLTICPAGLLAFLASTVLLSCSGYVCFSFHNFQTWEINTLWKIAYPNQVLEVRTWTVLFLTHLYLHHYYHYYYYCSSGDWF